jgi:RNA polymerase primary sigma factor
MTRRLRVDTYVRDIDATALLTADQERDLAWRIQDGDSEARDHMVRANLRLVVKIARHYLGNGLPMADLVAEGNLGLLRAVEAFDPDMDIRFSTYSSHWIKQSIRRGLTNTGRNIRLPNYMRQLICEWQRSAEWLERDLGRAPSEAEIAGVLGLSGKKLNLVKKGLRIWGAIPEKRRDDERTFDQLVADASTGTAEEALCKRDDLQQVLGLLDQLPPREATILRALRSERRRTGNTE